MSTLASPTQCSVLWSGTRCGCLLSAKLAQESSSDCRALCYHDFGMNQLRNWCRRVASGLASHSLWWEIMRCCRLCPLSPLQLEEMNCLCPMNLTRLVRIKSWTHSVSWTLHVTFGPSHRHIPSWPSNLFTSFHPLQLRDWIAVTYIHPCCVVTGTVCEQRKIRWFLLVYVGDHPTPVKRWLDHVYNRSDKLLNIRILSILLVLLMAPTMPRRLGYRSNVTIQTN